MSIIESSMTENEALTQTFRHLRESEFPWTAETTYLNNASIGPIPERTGTRVNGSLRTGRARQADQRSRGLYAIWSDSYSSAAIR